MYETPGGKLIEVTSSGFGSDDVAVTDRTLTEHKWP